MSGGLSGLAGAGAAVAAAFAGIVGSAAKAADEIGDVSDKLGVAPKALQELKFAAERSEVSFEGLQIGLQMLAKNAVEAANGNDKLQAAFGSTKLRNADGTFKSTATLLTELADKFVKMPDDTTRTATAMKLFGKSGAELVPLLKKGSAGIAELSAKANELGVVMSDDVIAAGGEFDDALKDVRDALTGLRNELGGPFIKVFAQGLAAVSRFFVRMRPQIQALTKALSDVGRRILGIGAAIFGVGERIGRALEDSLVGKLLKGVDAMALFEAVLIGLGVALTAVAAQAVIAWVAAAGPFILLAALIGLIVDDLWNFIEGNDSLLGRVSKWASAFDPNGNPVIEFFRSILLLLFDLTNPDKWEHFVSMWMRLNQALGDITVKTFEFVGAKIAELIGSGIQAVFDRFPLLKKLVGVGASINGGIAGALGFGGTFGAAQETVTDALGFGKTKRSDEIAAQLGGLVTGLNPFGGGASGPEAVGAIASTPAGSADSRSVKQTNNITINATQMNPQELASHIDNRLQSHHQEALASFPGGQ